MRENLILSQFSFAFELVEKRIHPCICRMFLEIDYFLGQWVEYVFLHGWAVVIKYAVQIGIVVLTISGVVFRIGIYLLEMSFAI